MTTTINNASSYGVHEVRIYYEDTDHSGVVYHVSFSIDSVEDLTNEMIGRWHVHATLLAYEKDGNKQNYTIKQFVNVTMNISALKSVKGFKHYCEN
jgi:hypothetical protein